LGTEEVLIAPVRPSWKEPYPLVPIEGYAAWPDGFLFDPWMRVHERLGARVLKAKPQSLRSTGSVPKWHTGAHWEQNVWMEHTI
jgi:hypothetical protein